MSESIASVNEESPRLDVREPIRNTARDVIDRLSMILASGIDARVYIDGPQGVAKNLDDFRRLQART